MIRFVRQMLLGVLLLAGVALAPVAPVQAQNCPSFTYILLNGQTADANQVMANFNTLLNCANNNLAHNGANSDITSLSGLTTPLSVPQGGTGLGTLTPFGIVVGNGTSTPSFVTPSSTSGFVLTSNGSAALPTYQAPPATGVPVRQTVLSGPVDSSGLPAFGGATGSTSITMSGTLIVTAANGFTVAGGVDTTGSGTNLVWTGLSTNGQMYLYVDVASGLLTPGTGTLAPTYQNGGTYAITNGQFTFNIQQMSGQVGNGATAAQTNRVYVGQVTVLGNVVTAITWYALMGRYAAPYTATLPAAATTITQNHNIGVTPRKFVLDLLNTTTDAGYAVGDVAHNFGTSDGSVERVMPYYASALTTGFRTANSSAFIIVNKTSGAGTVLTAGNWSYRMTADRGW